MSSRSASLGAESSGQLWRALQRETLRELHSRGSCVCPCFVGDEAVALHPLSAVVVGAVGLAGGPAFERLRAALAAAGCHVWAAPAGAAGVAGRRLAAGRAALVMPAVEPLYGGGSPRQGRWRRLASYHASSALRTSAAGRPSRGGAAASSRAKPSRTLRSARRLQLQWSAPYKACAASRAIIAAFDALGRHRYTAATSPSASRGDSMGACSVTPRARSSLTLTSGARSSRQGSSRIRTFQSMGASADVSSSSFKANIFRMACFCCLRMSIILLRARRAPKTLGFTS